MGVEETLRQNNAPKEVGNKLVDVSEQVLAENLGREPEPAELADLAETMISRLLSGAYLLVRQKGGLPEAETWLRKTLALGATLVRMSGSEAFIKIEISVREVPNKIAAQVHQEASEQAAPPPPCACAKDQEGRCPDCSGRLAIAYREFFGYFRKAAEFKDVLKGLCPACGREQLDRSIAGIMESLLAVVDQVDAEKKPFAAQQVLQLLYQMAVGQGVREIPLTIKAWKELLEAKGVKVEGPV